MESRKGNLTSGSIPAVLTRLALPIVAASFLSTAYSITDMIWIGTLSGKALSGIGIGSMFVWLSQGFSMIPKMGGQVLLAQELGRGNEKKARSYATSALQLTVLLGILYGSFCMISAPYVVALWGLKDPMAIRSAEIYLRITCGFVIFSYLGQVLTGLYTAQGNSRIPLKANFIGLLLNMILDPLLILGVGVFPRLETFGASIATILAQVVVVSVLVADIHKKKEENNILQQVNLFQKIDLDSTRSIFRIGTPSAVQNVVYCFISMCLSKIAGTFGDTAIGVQRVGAQIEALAWNIASGFSSALNAYCAQNFGAGKMDRVKEGYRISCIMIVVWSGCIASLFFLIPESISGIFFHTPGEIQMCAKYLQILGIGTVFNCVELLGVGALSGLGNTRLCSIISIILTGIRIPIAYVLSSTSLGVNGIWWAFSITSILKGITFHLVFYKRVDGGVRKIRKNYTTDYILKMDEK
ncbi:MAG: MATE family efflux transporter [Lachnospiraceae bacterium]